MLTLISGKKCGSTFVDLEFKRWLCKLIGVPHFRKLDPQLQIRNLVSHDMEGGKMRQLMTAFDILKTTFRPDSGEKRMKLPDPLHDLNIDGRKGEIIITK